ncbi:CAMK family protein kinase [Tritrichomonas foetus]|uniref:CAMK family protein kinase n=1 Tax=Tritrichomonas foetus TaxID=1144522 RepID=A0A1J4JAH1_9EUKA|nr:CAMK family protein kinase [Tritrichomonas foetus]|eukprot:OHS94643.1 CAMK family protein kinase [Tritrichomonas foetus]
MSESMVIAPSKIGPYILRGTVGEGAFSVVKLAYNEQQKEYFACKIVPKKRLSGGNLEARFEMEIRINQQMHHPGVVGIQDVLKDDFNYYILMEFCPNGELFQFIVDRNHLIESEAKIMIRQILETLDYIHNIRVCHRDLKPENILIDKFGHLKISDFGLSKFVDIDGLVTTPCGSPCYASPECVSGKSYNGRKSDIWSVGVISYAMMTGQLPWTKRNQTQLFEQIKKGEYVVPNFLSVPAQKFIKGLMTVDNTKRFTIYQALQHPFLQDTPQQHPVGAPLKIISMKQIDIFFEKDRPGDNNSEIFEKFPTTTTSPEFDFDSQKKIISSSMRNLLPNAENENDQNTDNLDARNGLMWHNNGKLTIPKHQSAVAGQVAKGPKSINARGLKMPPSALEVITHARKKLPSITARPPDKGKRRSYNESKKELKRPVVKKTVI